LSGDQADVAGATAHVEHRHPATDASIFQEALGKWIEQFALRQQSLDGDVVMSKGVRQV
jgi:hypothetical protein